MQLFSGIGKQAMQESDPWEKRSQAVHDHLSSLWGDSFIIVAQQAGVQAELEWTKDTEIRVWSKWELYKGGASEVYVWAPYEPLAEGFTECMQGETPTA